MEGELFRSVFASSGGGHAKGEDPSPTLAEPVGPAPSHDGSEEGGGDDEDPEEEKGYAASCATETTMSAPDVPRRDPTSGAASSVASADAAASDSHIENMAAFVRARLLQPEGSQGAPAPASSEPSSSRGSGLRRLATPRAAAQSSSATSAAPPAGSEDDPDSQMHPMTLDAPWPKSQLFKAVHRSRSTINLHTLQLAEAGWYEAQKPATLTSLRGRCMKHQAHIMSQVNLDVQIAFRQCLRRVQALLTLQQALRHWIDSPQGASIARILPPLSLLELVLDRLGTSLGPDIRILKAYALFYTTYEEHKSTSIAMKVLVREDMEESVQKYEHWVKSGRLLAAKRPAVKDEADEDGDMETDSIGRATAKPSPKKKLVAQPLTNRINLMASARTQAAHLTAEGLKLFFFTMPKRMSENGGLAQAAAEEVSNVCQVWADVWEVGRDENDATTDFGDFLRALQACLECSLPDEKLPPPQRAGPGESQDHQ